MAKRTKKSVTSLPSEGTKTRPTKQEKMMAKTAWMNGLTLEEVCEVGNCSPRTLEAWQADWDKERIQALMALKLRSTEFNVGDKELQEHADYVEGLRTLKSQHEQELERVDDIANLLEGVLSQLSQHPDFDAKEFKAITGTIRSYSNMRIARSNLQKDYIACCKALNTETGVTAYHQAATKKIAEVEKARGRLEVQKERRAEGLLTHKDMKEGGSFFEVS